MPYKAKEQLEEQMKEIMAKKERVANLKAQFQEQGIMPTKPFPPIGSSSGPQRCSRRWCAPWRARGGA